MSSKQQAPTVPIILDPANADQRYGDPEFVKLAGGQRLHHATRSALASMYDAAGELAEAVRAVAGKGAAVTTRPRPDSVSLTPDGRHLVSRPGGIETTHRGDVRATSGGLRAFSGHEARLVDAAAQRFERVARQVDSTLAAIDDVEAMSTKSIDLATRDPKADTVNGALELAEVRAFLRDMKPSERWRFVNQRIAANDLQAAHAALHGPSYLIELEEDTRAALADEAAAKFAPDANRVRLAARDARKLIESASSTFVKGWRESTTPLGKGEAEQRAAVERLGGAA